MSKKQNKQTVEKDLQEIERRFGQNNQTTCENTLKNSIPSPEWPTRLQPIQNCAQLQQRAGRWGICLEK